MSANVFHLLHTINIEKRKKGSLKTTHLTLRIGNIMKQQIHLLVRIIADYIIYMNLIGQIDMALKGHLKSMRVKIVQTVHYVPYAQRRKRVIIESYFTMKSGNIKKN